MAYGELALRPSIFRLLTPAEFFALHAGYERRLSNETEREARWAMIIANSSGNYKPPLTIEAILGRPLRANWEAAKEKNPELEAKDEARRKMNQET